MDNEEHHDNPNITFKQQHNRTPIDLREQLAFNVTQNLQLRKLSSLIEDEEEFQVFVLVLISVIHQIQEDLANDGYIITKEHVRSFDEFFHIPTMIQHEYHLVFHQFTFHQ